MGTKVSRKLEAKRARAKRMRKKALAKEARLQAKEIARTQDQFMTWLRGFASKPKWMST
jgi:hypothetical protein